MRKLALKKLLFFTLLLLVSTASAVPTSINDRIEYSRSLNSVATIVMNWYGSLIDQSESKVTFDNFDFMLRSSQAEKYRSTQYPKHIKQIMITSTKLLKLGNDYQFNIISKINYKKNNQLLTKLFNETFLFENLLTTNQPKIKNIHLNISDNTDVLSAKGYDRQHYKRREFVYAWLAYLDGVNTFKPVMNANTDFKNASYNLDMGSLKTTSSVKEILAKRKNTLNKGGHLLRSLDFKKVKETNNQFILDLIIEWKGTNINGKAVIARIHQVLTIQINADNSWQLISIKEKHLLPVIAPWMGMLC